MSLSLDHLNEQQKEAVLHTKGPALVLAGAGSGKTTVLTTRAARLILEENVPTNAIMLVTFTNKAANEMKQRIQKLTGSSLPLAGTFHSLSSKILRKDGYLIGLDSNFVIYDSNDQQSLMKEIYKAKGIDAKTYNINATKATISSAKNELISASDYENYAQGSFQNHVAKVYHWYQQALQQAQAVDFDDLLVKLVLLMQNNQHIREKYQNMIEYVLVDEYQDTNKAQYTLTKLFAKPHDNVFVVGDFSQSIYAWRGADYRNMLNLSQDFTDLTEYSLEQNYRSTQTILDAATEVISKNKSHPILKLWTTKSESEHIKLLETQTGDEEAQEVIKKIRQASRDYSLSDIAILYRTNAQSRLFEEALIYNHIPYKLVGGTKFYDRKEIKDLLSYLRLVVNPLDTISLQRVQKIGKRKYNDFETWRSNQENVTELHPVEALKHIFEKTLYLEFFDRKDPDDMSRLENIEELVTVASQFTSISSFLENIALIQDNYFIDTDGNKADDQQSVTLMSLHSAKGLEFSVVFMVGMEDGLLPHSRSLLDIEQMEEERRLCYVGITRAKDHLYLTYARSRYQYGSSSNSLRSRFIADIPNYLLDIESKVKNSSPTRDPWDTRHIVVDDDDVNQVLAGDMDIDAFIDS